MPRLVSACAAGISSWRTVRGISASREGRCIEEVEASTAASAKTSHSCGSGPKAPNALAASTAVATAWATPVATSSRLRSTWSASAPPYRPKTTRGTSSTSPTRPTARLEPVSV